MAKLKKDEILEEEQEEKILTPEEQMKSFIKDNKEDFFNEEPEYNYIIPSGSLKLDKAMKGGVGPGIIRMVGSTEAGKSSSALSFMRNFLKYHDNARGVIIPSEGRLNAMMRNRADLPFVRDYKEWKNKTCFIAETPIYETCINMVRDLIMHNPTNTRYVFIIDSVDALNPRGDYAKPFGENMRVAGGAALASDFLKKMAMITSSMGHLIFLLGQVRSNVQINQYVVENDNTKIDPGSNSNAILHYSNWILEFKGTPAKSDKIWSEEGNKGNILGHFCEIRFCKTPVEKTGVTVKYPIKHEEIGDKCIWKSYEVADELIAWGQVKKEGKSWLYFQENTLNFAKEKGVELPEKINGMDKFYKYFEENPEITDILVERIKDVTMW